MDIERLVQVHGERDRAARDEGELDVAPVVVRGVLDDRPALEERRLLVGEHEPVARLPDRGRDDVGNAHFPLSLALEADRDGLLLGVVAGSQHGQRLAELGVEPRVEQLDALDLVERDRAEPIVGQQVQVLDVNRLVVGNGLLLGLDAQHRAGERPGRGQFDAVAADLAEQSAEAGVGRQVDPEALQGLVDRVARAVGDGRDRAAGVILNDEALEQVVDVLGLEPKLDLRVPLDLAVALEVADAAGVEDHPRQRQSRPPFGPLRLRGPRLGETAHAGQPSQDDQQR